MEKRMVVSIVNSIEIKGWYSGLLYPTAYFSPYFMINAGYNKIATGI